MLELVKPKINTLDNQELSHLFQSLVLLPPQDVSFTKPLELMTMRRIHAIDADHVAQIIKAYAMLLEQNKLASGASITFVQTFEQKISGNQQVFQRSLNSLVQAAAALCKLYVLSRQPNSPAPVVTQSALLTTIEQVVFEMQADSENEDESEVDAAQLAQFYCDCFFFRFRNETKKTWMGVPFASLLIKNEIVLEALNN